MANDQELKEIKETLQKLEGQVAQIRADSKRQRSGFARFFIGFFIVFFAIIIASGVIQFISHNK
ncbi:MULTISPECIES: hypothetical protein [Bacillales]|uniref:hypothetical protein n=1 Tax=Bacillales TaxID=1385 RepID=UPI0006A79277|nr:MULTISPECIES: hypothetical protein [Bacillales]OBZ16791.1 hypothetical protein A7975_02475 [Bacillus sp. FJAT-26390]